MTLVKGYAVLNVSFSLHFRIIVYYWREIPCRIPFICPRVFVIDRGLVLHYLHYSFNWFCLLRNRLRPFMAEKLAKVYRFFFFFFLLYQLLVTGNCGQKRCNFLTDSDSVMGVGQTWESNTLFELPRNYCETVLFSEMVLGWLVGYVTML